ncbi:hypothetical protein INR49_024628, partial [Caranx melampygus]
MTRVVMVPGLASQWRFCCGEPSIHICCCEWSGVESAVVVGDVRGELGSDTEADDSGDEEPTSQSDRSEIQGTLKILVSKLDDLSTCNDLIAKHGAALQRSLSELEGLKVPVEGGEKIKAVNERATLFRITSNAMINACRDFLDLAETH